MKQHIIASERLPRERRGLASISRIVEKGLLAFHPDTQSGISSIRLFRCLYDKPFFPGRSKLQARHTRDVYLYVLLFRRVHDSPPFSS